MAHILNTTFRKALVFITLIIKKILVTLRGKITQIYEHTFPRIVEAGQSTEKFDIRKLLYPYYKKHFELSNEQSDRTGLSGSLVAYEYKIKEYDSLREDNEFIIDLQKSF
ncbi:MAG: hypothetical protein E4H26_10640 [Flavobacteriales bacterium]|nr:MAG: hypothetical protein E4H26_10640 [Flavobacteriales bacterium]